MHCRVTTVTNPLWPYAHKGDGLWAAKKAQRVHVGFKPAKKGRIAPPSAFLPGQADQFCAISSSKLTAFSVILALDNTNSVTLFSITMASTSAMRRLSPWYQRTTSAGFS